MLATAGTKGVSLAKVPTSTLSPLRNSKWACNLGMSGDYKVSSNA